MRRGAPGRGARQPSVAAGPMPGAQSLRRAVRILRILAIGQEHGVRLTDVAHETGLNRPTVYRMLRVLSEEGAVEQDPDTRRYKIGQEISLLGLARTARFPIRAVADPYLRHVCEEAGDTTFLTIRSGLDSICIDRKVGSYPVQVLSIEVGARRPLGVGVGGLALLAFLPEDEAAALVRANEQRFAQHQFSVSKIMDRIRATRARGYAYADIGLVRGTRAISVPVFNTERHPVAAISIAATADRLSLARVASLTGMMKQQAELVSRRLAALGAGRRSR